MLVCSKAGLLNVMGGYDDTPEDMARDNEKFFENGWLNMVVGTPFTLHPANLSSLSSKCWVDYNKMFQTCQDERSILINGIDKKINRITHHTARFSISSQLLCAA